MFSKSKEYLGVFPRVGGGGWLMYWEWKIRWGSEYLQRLENIYRRLGLVFSDKGRHKMGDFIPGSTMRLNF